MQQSAEGEEEPGHEQEEEEHADAQSVQADDQPEEPFYASSDGEGEGISIELIRSMLQSVMEDLDPRYALIVAFSQLASTSCLVLEPSPLLETFIIKLSHTPTGFAYQCIHLLAGGVNAPLEDGANDEAATEQPQQAPQPATAAPVPQAAEPAAKAGTAAWYRERLHEPVYAGASLTLLECCYLWLSMKLEGNVRDGQFDREARVMHDIMLPQPNIFPPSFYLFKQIIGCKAVQDFECHCCPNECKSWGPLPQNQWAVHEQDVCFKCGSGRFKRVGTGSSSKLTPHKVGIGIMESQKRAITPSSSSV